MCFVPSFNVLIVEQRFLWVAVGDAQGVHHTSGRGKGVEQRGRRQLIRLEIMEQAVLAGDVRPASTLESIGVYVLEMRFLHKQFYASATL